MTSFLELAHRYAEFHQKPLTRYIQMIGILMIYLAFMIILSCVHIVVPAYFDMNVAFFITVGFLAYYFYAIENLPFVIIIFI